VQLSSAKRIFPNIGHHRRRENPVFEAISSIQEGRATDALEKFCGIHGRDFDTVQRQLEFTFTSSSDGGRKDITLNEIFLSAKFQPDLHYIVDVALTLPVTTASVERAFSRLRLIKSHLRTTMSASRLQSLVRISANLHLTNQIPLSHLMEQFTKFERRVIFK
jgi:hypothetical protein